MSTVTELEERITELEEQLEEMYSEEEYEAYGSDQYQDGYKEAEEKLADRFHDEMYDLREHINCLSL